jgi:transglutaminase-like putative cysteine protease
MNIKKIAAVLLSTVYLVSLTLAFLPKPTQASENFSSDYNVTYIADEAGLTKIRQDVGITNLTSKFFVSKYSFTIGSEDIQNIEAWDTTGPLTPEIEKKDGGTIITLNFRARAYGKGKRLSFGISYEFPGLASQNGLIWEINLLKITGLADTSRYDLSLSVPKSFGSLLYSSPSPKNIDSSDTQTTISYAKDELSIAPPRLAFGEFQLYELGLTYHLENPSITLGYTEIALPPDVTSQQQVILKKINPEPVSVRVDADGNYLARYNLGPREKKEVVWEGLVAMFYQPRQFTEEEATAIPQELIDLYTKAVKFWEVESSEIIAKAQEIFDDNLPTSQNAENIFNFVRDYLSYDQTRLAGGDITRMGAASALSNKDSAVCMEYTDLFIALSRAAGIPAREVNGFAYTADESQRPLSLQLEGGDVLHAWPEIYLPGSGWLMVDPTWSATSGNDYFSAFDLSHITFVRKGISSEYPLPAGSYKTETGQRDVKVTLSSETTVVDQSPQLSVEISFPLISVSPFPTTATVKVENTSKVAAFGTEATLTSNLLKIEGDEVVALGAIPPEGTTELKVRLVSESFKTKGVQTLQVEVSASSFSGEEVSAGGEEKTTINPLYLPLPLPYLIALIAAASLSYFLNRRIVRKIKRR